MRTSLAVASSAVLCLGLVTATTAQEQPVPVTSVTGMVTAAYGHDVSIGAGPDSYDVRGYEVMTERPGFVIHEIVEWSDPRLPPDLWLTLSYTLIWTGEDQNELDGAINHAWRCLLEDEQGRWRGTGRSVKGADERYSLYELTGEGAYEGLSALLRGTTSADAHGPQELAYEGYIFEAELTSFSDEPIAVSTEGLQLYRSGVGPEPGGAPDSSAPSPSGTSPEAADPMAPATFTLTLEPLGEPTWGTERDSEDGRVLEERGTGEVYTAVAADSRASGVLTSVRNRNQIEVDEGGLQTVAFRMRLANDDGSWTGTDHGMMAFTDAVLGAAAGVTVLTGEGGYEGLTLVLNIPWSMPGRGDADTAWGIIVPSDLMPPMPGPIAPTAKSEIPPDQT